MNDPTGVVFPEVDGRRSTSATGRGIVADALRPVDPVGAAAAQRETNWRTGYLTHFRRLVDAGLTTPQAAVTIADAGLASVHDRMRWRDADGNECALDAALGGVVGSPAAHRVTESHGGGGEPAPALPVAARRSMAVRAAINQMVCVLIAVVLWLFRVDNNFWTGLVFSLLIGNACWLLIDVGRLVVGRWLYAPQQYVLCHRKIGAKIDLLVDRADAQRLGLMG